MRTYLSMTLLRRVRSVPITRTAARSAWPAWPARRSEPSSLESSAGLSPLCAHRVQKIFGKLFSFSDHRFVWARDVDVHGLVGFSSSFVVYETRANAFDLHTRLSLALDVLYEQALKA